MNANPIFEPTDEEIGKAAYLLYLASGCVPGRDLENWLAARARIASQQSSLAEKVQSAPTPQLHFPPNTQATRGPFASLSPFENRN